MRFKKITAVVTASLIAALSLSLCVFADDEEEYEVEVTSEESEEVISSDGNYSYTTYEEEDGETYATLEDYIGNDTVVDIPDEVDGITVRNLGHYTFYEDENVTQINIPATVEILGDFPFFGCSSLTEITVDEENEVYKISDDGALISIDETVLVTVPCGLSPKEYEVSEGIDTIRAGAFGDMKSLEKITLPESLAEIGIFCFSECSSLNNVVIPDGVSELPKFAFAGCTSLSEITLPDTMHTIGEAAFYMCTALEKIEFPAYLQEIKQCAFVSVGFDTIEVPSTVQAIGYSAFGFVTNDAGEIIADDDFVLKGYEGSYAQTYASENEVEFVAIEEDEDIDEESHDHENESDDSSDENEDGGMKSGIKIAIVVAIVLVAGVAAIIIIKTNGSADEESENTEEPESKEDIEDTEKENGEETEGEKESENDEETEKD